MEIEENNEEKGNKDKSQDIMEDEANLDLQKWSN